MIQKANKTDLHSIKQLLTVNNLPIEDVQLGKIHFFIFKNESRIVGTIGLEEYDNIGLIRSLAVVNPYKSRGIGTKLVKYLLDYCQSKNIDYVYLLTTTAHEYFFRFGFKIIDRAKAPESIRQTSEFKDICPATAICMIKEN